MKGNAEHKEVHDPSPNHRGKISTPFNKEGEQPFFSRTAAVDKTPAFFHTHPIQTKLTIGQPDDKYEKEADDVADHVVQRLANPASPTDGEENVSQPETQPLRIQRTSLGSMQPIQRKCSECGAEMEEHPQGEGLPLQMKPIFDSGQPEEQQESVQTKCASCEAKQQAAENTSLEDRLNTSKGGGRSLPKETQHQMEVSMGADFSSVRIHDDGGAVQMSKDLGAHAFTHGSDIYFNSGKYNTESVEGKRLLAHELTHTIQQGKSPLIQRKSQLSKTSEDRIQGNWFTDAASWAGGKISEGADAAWSGAKWAGGKAVEGADAAWEGAKWAGGKAIEGAEWVGGKAYDAFMWVYDKIKGLVDSGKEWIQEKWDNLKKWASAGVSGVKALFNNVLGFIKSPFSFLIDAIMNMDEKKIRAGWGSFSLLVLKTWDSFQAIGTGVIDGVSKVWEGISGYADKLLNKVDSWTNHWAFKKLPSSVQSLARKIIQGLKSFWNGIKTAWNVLLNKVKEVVKKIFKKIRVFVDNILSFAIDAFINGVVMFGKLLIFLRKFLKNPKKYLQPLAQKITKPLLGAEGNFQGQFQKHVMGEEGGQSLDGQQTTSGSGSLAIQKKDDSSIKDSATWSEIGDGIWEMMAKKWEEVKKDPLSIIFNLLLDMVLPIVGNVKDVIKLFKDIKKIVAKPLGASSLKEFWTSLLHILDIPILIYNTVWSIIGRSLMVPLIIASFVPHPVVKGIAVAVGYALLGALIQGELANIGHKILLLKTGDTNDEEKKDAYNSLADSLIALALELAMAILVWVISAVANVVKGVFGFVKSKVFTPKSKGNTPDGKAKIDVDGGGGKKTSLPDEGKKTELPDGGGKKTDVPDGGQKTDTPDAGKKGTPEENLDGNIEKTKKVSPDHELKYTKNGKVYLCSKFCLDITDFAKKYKDDIANNDWIKNRLDKIGDISEPKAKKKALEELELEVNTRKIDDAIENANAELGKHKPGSEAHDTIKSAIGRLEKVKRKTKRGKVIGDDLDAEISRINRRVEEAGGGTTSESKPSIEVKPKDLDPPGTEFKKPKSGLTGKEGATDIPDWVRNDGYNPPRRGEAGKDYARRVLDHKFPENAGKHDTGPGSDFNQIKKWADRHFEDPT